MCHHRVKLGGDLHLLVRCMLLAPLAKLLEFELPFHLLLVLRSIVVGALALLALQLEQIILRHS